MKAEGIGGEREGDFNVYKQTQTKLGYFSMQPVQMLGQPRVGV